MTLVQVTGSVARKVDCFLDVKLSKTGQCSDWSPRPLAEEEQEYSALDAAVSMDAVTVNLTKQMTMDMTECLQSERVLSSSTLVFVDDAVPYLCSRDSRLNVVWVIQYCITIRADGWRPNDTSSSSWRRISR